MGQQMKKSILWSRFPLEAPISPTSGHEPCVPKLSVTYDSSYVVLIWLNLSLMTNKRIDGQLSLISHLFWT